MLDVARQKGIYAELHRMELGESLAFEDDSFANTISVGTITPGHAPPNSFDELIRVTRKGGAIIFGLRVDDGQDPAYPAAVAEHEKTNRWSKVFETQTFASMPLGEPEVIHKVFVYRIT
jgi:SAM-dependent methyltransferase